jgi:hypothetical protein
MEISIHVYNVIEVVSELFPQGSLIDILTNSFANAAKTLDQFQDFLNGVD